MNVRPLEQGGRFAYLEHLMGEPNHPSFMRRAVRPFLPLTRLGGIAIPDCKPAGLQAVESVLRLGPRT